MANTNADALAQAQGLYEPQRSNNWLFTVTDTIAGADILSGEGLHVALETANLPTLTIEEIELNFLNSKRFVAGKATYETIPLTIKDMVDVGIANAFKVWSEMVYNPETDQIGLAKDYKKNCEITLFAPDGSAERSWLLVGCWIQSANWGTLDMSSSEPVKIELTLRYDKAKPTLTNTGAA